MCLMSVHVQHPLLWGKFLQTFKLFHGLHVDVLCLNHFNKFYDVVVVVVSICFCFHAYSLKKFQVDAVLDNLSESLADVALCTIHIHSAFDISNILYIPASCWTQCFVLKSIFPNCNYHFITNVTIFVGKFFCR